VRWPRRGSRKDLDLEGSQTLFLTGTLLFLEDSVIGVGKPTLGTRSLVLKPWPASKR
jgi:hypothetical protein